MLTLSIESQTYLIMHLKVGTLLKGGAYRIETVLGQGGFGITYLALQLGLDRNVAVKEFFVKEHCERDTSTSYVTMGTSGSRELVSRFKEKFIKEAQTIAGMDNSHIIRVIDVFEDNGTAYYVMEYLSGGSLSDRIPSEGLGETKAVAYIRQIADALTYIHEEKKILHLDVKPSNILFRKSGEAVLIDFGISKHYDDDGGGQTSSTPVGVSRGYAPLEQYKRGGVAQFSPATDVYSLGATLYKMLTGQAPPDADEIYENGLPSLPVSFSASVRSAVEKAMSPRRKDRPQSVKAFLKLLETAPARSVPRIVIGQEPQVSDQSRRVSSDSHHNNRPRPSVSPVAPVEPKQVKVEPASPKPRRIGLVLGIVAGIVAVVALFMLIPGVPDEVRQDKYQYDSLISKAESLASDSRMLEAKTVYDLAASYESKYSGGRYSVNFNASAMAKALEIQSKLDVADKKKKAEENRSIAEEQYRREERERREREEAERRRNEPSYSNGILRVKGVEYPMVYVSGDTFIMGATSEQIGEAESDEKPVHRVTLDSYSIGRYEVTQELWEAVMDSNPSSYRGARKPVENVSWNDCQNFIHRLNSLTGQNFRLPTEAEWEFAARGGNSSKGHRYSGGDSLGSIAWYDGNSGGSTHDVGTKSPNELGIYDMSGNVWEWCSDRYGSYSSSSQTNPNGPSSGQNRVNRGGSWYSIARDCRVANRISGTLESRYDNIGFRLCL